MGITKTVVKHKAGKVADDALDSMGAVGDVIDKHTTTGPLDKADDAVDKAADDLKKRTKDKKR